MIENDVKLMKSMVNGAEWKKRGLKESIWKTIKSSYGLYLCTYFRDFRVFIMFLSIELAYKNTQNIHYIAFGKR